MKKIIPTFLSAALILGACAPMSNDPYGYSGGGSSLAPAAGAIGAGAVSGLACSALGRGNGKTAIVGACSMLGGIAGLLMGYQYSQQRTVAQAYPPQRQATAFGQMQQLQQIQPPYEGEGVLTMKGQYFNQSTGEYCREFQHTAKVAGKVQKVFGTACQQPDGTWKVVG